MVGLAVLGKTHVGGTGRVSGRTGSLEGSAGIKKKRWVAGEVRKDAMEVASLELMRAVHSAWRLEFARSARLNATAVITRDKNSDRNFPDSLSTSSSSRPRIAS